MEQVALMISLGIVGCGVEGMFNAFRTAVTIKPTDWTLMGKVSLWMFPVYAFGLGYGWDFIAFATAALSDSDWVRWLSYPLWIWFVELVIGCSIKKPLWDYSNLPFNWRGIISFIHFPVWLVFGIGIEKLRFFLITAIATAI